MVLPFKSPDHESWRIKFIRFSDPCHSSDDRSVLLNDPMVKLRGHRPFGIKWFQIFLCCLAGFFCCKLASCQLDICKCSKYREYMNTIVYRLKYTYTHARLFWTMKNTMHIWNASIRWIDVPILSHYRLFEVIMSTLRCKWVSLCEMHWYRPFRLSDISGKERKDSRAAGKEGENGKEDKERNYKELREGKSTREF